MPRHGPVTACSRITCVGDEPSGGATPIQLLSRGGRVLGTLRSRSTKSDSATLTDSEYVHFCTVNGCAAAGGMPAASGEPPSCFSPLSLSRLHGSLAYCLSPLPEVDYTCCGPGISVWW